MKHPSDEILIDLLLNELSESEARQVHEHVESCDECSERIRKLMSLLSTLDEYPDVESTVSIKDKVLAELEFTPPVQIDFIPPERIIKIANRRRPLLAGFAVAAVLLFAIYLGQVGNLPGVTFSKGMLNAKLEIPSEVAPDSALPVSLSIWDEVRKPDKPFDHTVQVNYMLASDDRVVFERESSASAYGTTDELLDLSGIKPGGYNLKAQINGKDIVNAPINISPSYEVMIIPDRPVYRPNDEIRLRVAAREYSGSAADDVDAAFVLRGPLDCLVKHDKKKLDSFGTANFNYHLADLVPLGEYTATVKVGESEAVEKIIVDDFTLPKFKVEIESERDYITQSSIFRGNITAEYFFGEPVDNADVRIEWFVQDGLLVKRIIEITGKTDDNGNLPLAIDARNLYQQTASSENEIIESYIKVTVIDSAHQREEIIKSYPLAGEPVIIRMFSSNGKITRALNNRIFIFTSLPNGEPVSCKLKLTLADKILDAETSSLGVYSFDYTPESIDEMLEVSASYDDTKTVDRDFPLSITDSRFPFIIRPLKAVYRHNEHVELELMVPYSTNLTAHMDMYKGNHWVSSQDVDLSDTSTRTEMLVSGAWGEMTIEASLRIGHNEIARDKTIVFIEEPDELNVAVNTDSQTYKPSEMVNAKINVDAHGVSRQASCGIIAADKSLLAAGEKASATSKLISDTLLAGLDKGYFAKEDLSSESEQNDFSLAMLGSISEQDRGVTSSNSIDYRFSPEQSERNTFQYLVMANYSLVIMRFILTGLLYIAIVLSMIAVLVNIHRGTFGRINIRKSAMTELKSYAGLTSLAVLFFALSIRYPNLIIIGIGLLVTMGVAVKLAQCISQKELVANNITLVQIISSTAILITTLLLAHQGIWQPVLRYMGKMHPLMSLSLLSILASIGCLMIVATFLIPVREGEKN
jgi:hypothetical protein